MPKGERYLLGCSGYLLWESQAFCLSLLRLQACETFFILLRTSFMHGVRHVNPYLLCTFIYASYVSLSLVPYVCCRGSLSCWFLGFLVMHMLRGSLSLLVILLNYYVVINTKKGVIESASIPLTGFGINDNIIIYF